MGGEELETESQRNGKWAAGGPAEGERQAGGAVGWLWGERALCAPCPSCSGNLEAGEPSKLAGEASADPHSGPVTLTPAPWCPLLR